MKGENGVARGKGRDNYDGKGKESDALVARTFPMPDTEQKSLQATSDLKTPSRPMADYCSCCRQTEHFCPSRDFARQDFAQTMCVLSE